MRVLTIEQVLVDDCTLSSRANGSRRWEGVEALAITRDVFGTTYTTLGCSTRIFSESVEQMTRGGKDRNCNRRIMP